MTTTVVLGVAPVVDPRCLGAMPVAIERPMAGWYFVLLDIRPSGQSSRLMAIPAQRIEKVKLAVSRARECEKSTFCTPQASVWMNNGIA